MNKQSDKNTQFLYFDNNSTTRLDDRILDEILPYYTDYYANAASSHFFGQKINKAVQNARINVANLINCSDREIVFTSGSTEGINIALQGLALASVTKKHIITVETEHKAVLDTCKYLESIGTEVTYLTVSSEGLISLDELENSIRKDTFAICAMWVNNETGVLNQIQAIGKIAKQNKLIFICDATQAVGKIAINVIDNNIDILIFSAHKFYGPKGIGALYINSSTIPKGSITSIIHGGGHERGLRSGTLNVPGIIGLSAACAIALDEMSINQQKILLLRNQLEKDILENIPGCTILGSLEQRIFNTSNICIPDFDANMFIGLNKHIAVSNGSACTSAIVEPSHVLKAMGLDDEQAFASLRISIGKWNTESEVTQLIGAIKSFLAI